MPDAAPARPGARKKTIAAAARAAAARAARRAAAAARDPADLVFFDEASTPTARTRARARSPRGTRATGAAPRNRGPDVTLVAPLTPTGMGPAVPVPGAATRPVFARFVAALPAPSLRPGRTVVLGDPAVHQRARARALIGAAGGRPPFPPAYSPGFSPIAPVFAPIKARLRAAAARTPGDLLVAVAEALAAVVPGRARACYRHCGDRIIDQ